MPNRQAICRVVREVILMDWSWSPGGGPVIPCIRRKVRRNCICEPVSRRIVNVDAKLSVKEERLAIHEGLNLIGLILLESGQQTCVCLRETSDYVLNVHKFHMTACWE